MSLLVMLAVWYVLVNTQRGTIRADVCHIAVETCGMCAGETQACADAAAERITALEEAAEAATAEHEGALAEAEVGAKTVLMTSLPTLQCCATVGDVDFAP